MTIRWRAGGATDIGRVRRTNEDSFRVDESNGVFLVADGVGGHAAGEVASALAAESVHATLTAAANGSDASISGALATAFHQARERLVEHVIRDRRTRGMGTTLTAAVLRPTGRLLLGHLGDSRLYRFSVSGGLCPLTRDHTWLQREIDAGRLTTGTSAAGTRLSHTLTRVVSPDEPSSPDIDSVTIGPGETLLLCSDGLHNLVHDQEIAEILGFGSDAAGTAEHLIAEANRRGGHDNVTAVVVNVLDELG